MPLNPSKFLHFDSWKQLRQWLPEATESQLMTVFVWAGDLKPPPGDVRGVSEIRNAAFELLVERTRERLRRFLMQRCHCSDAHLVEDLVQRTIEPCRIAMKDAGIDVGAINDVILVGGQTRMPLVAPPSVSHLSP